MSAKVHKKKSFVTFTQHMHLASSPSAAFLCGFYLERLKSLSRVTKLERPVEEYFKRNLYVTSSGMWNQTYLQRAMEIVGPERILFSTDYPYQYRPGRPGRSFLLGTDLPQEARKAFAHGNWEELTSRT